MDSFNRRSSKGAWLASVNWLDTGLVQNASRRGRGCGSGVVWVQDSPPIILQNAKSISSIAAETVDLFQNNSTPEIIDEGL